MIEIVPAYKRSENEWCICCDKSENTKRIRFSRDGSKGTSVVLCEDCRKELIRTLEDGEIGVRRYITADEAINLLPDKDEIHTFYQVSFGLLGADWSRSEVIDHLKTSGMVIEITGSQARNMGHGIAAYPKDAKKQSQILFIETDKNKLDAFDEGETI